uniref:RRM domain-containing protein n=1 Tax=Periophthalmus magnuspinnatus TaxID=409849 RepID=A0A3B3ZC73_9GOBI
MEELNGTEILGRTVRLDYVGEKSKNRRGEGGRFGGQFKTLFVRGLSEDTTDETLKEAFKGSVSARIVSDRDTGVSKGYGFVEFETEEACNAAKESMEGKAVSKNNVVMFCAILSDGCWCESEESSVFVVHLIFFNKNDLMVQKTLFVFTL